jgi:hypothetical protein
MKRHRPRATRHHLAELHATLLSILPRIELHGRVYFRHKNANAREELTAEMVGLCWKWFLRLVERGKDPTAFVWALATFAARAVNSGRRVCGQERSKYVLSPSAQRRHGFVVERLPAYSTLCGTPLEEALVENTATPVPEQVSFRLDFPAWRLSRCYRDRQMIDRMMLGERTLDLSKQFGVSPARVSQLRGEFHNDWQRFCGELDGVGTTRA